MVHSSISGFHHRGTEGTEETRRRCICQPQRRRDRRGIAERLVGRAAISKLLALSHGSTTGSEAAQGMPGTRRVGPCTRRVQESAGVGTTSARNGAQWRPSTALGIYASLREAAELNRDGDLRASSANGLLPVGLPAVN